MNASGFSNGSDSKLLPDQGGKVFDNTTYVQVELLYSDEQIDICSQNGESVLASPRMSHWHIAIQVLQNLKRGPDRGLILQV